MPLDKGSAPHLPGIEPAANHHQVRLPDILLPCLGHRQRAAAQLLGNPLGVLLRIAVLGFVTDQNRFHNVSSIRPMFCSSCFIL